MELVIIQKLKNIMLYSLEQVFLLYYNISPIRSNHLMMKQSLKKINVKKDPDQKTIRFLFNKFEQAGIVADNLAKMLDADD